MNDITTFTDFLLESERKTPKAEGNFTLLLVQLENAIKIIASHVRESGLVDIIGSIGKKNVFEEEVQKLDELSNNLIVKLLTASGQTHTLVSEEVEKAIITPKNKSGDYIVYFDPLDGSSNVDTNSPIGTIFSIYHKRGGLLQKGRKQIAAGYAIYGSSTMLVFTTGKEVSGFTLDPSIGSFLLSHPNMKIPQEGNYYSANEAYFEKYDKKTQDFFVKQKSKPNSSLRYVGSLIADVHRTLLKGGVYLYPKDKNHPEGKIRLMLEVNPMSFLVEAAGGLATTGEKDPLDVKPVHIHERSPLIVGSKKNVLEYIHI